LQEIFEKTTTKKQANFLVMLFMCN